MSDHKTKNLSRRSMMASSLATVAGGTALAGFGIPAFAQDAAKLGIALDWIFDAEFAGLFAAVENGYFTDYDLDPTLFPGGPNAPDPLVSLAAGRVQMGQSLWLPFLSSRAKGNDFVVIGAGFPVNPGCLITRGDLKIETASDLMGKTMLIQYPSLKTELEGIARFNGLEPDFKTAPTGFVVDPLFAGDGDAFLAFMTNQPLVLEAGGMVRGEDFNVTPLVDLGYPVPTSMFTVQREFLDTNRDSLVGMLAAWIRGWQNAEANPDKALSLVVDGYGRDLGLDPENQRLVMAENIKLLKSADEGLYFHLPEKQRADMIEFARATGFDDLRDDEQLFDMSLLEDAYRLVAG